METLTACPSCGSNHFNSYLEVKDHSVSHEVFHLTQCKECELIFTNPRPLPSDLGDYYQSENYVSHTNKGNNPVNIIYKLARTQTLRWKYKLINSYHPKTLLDYGCGTGHFLSYCKQKGLLVSGFEPDEYARNIARSQVGNSIQSDISLLNGEFEVITLWHVLEHVSLLNEVMLWLKEKLSIEGRLIIALPNYESLDSKLFESFWAAYDVPRHLYHFGKKSFENLVKKYGFCIESIHPMKLDSYYVSLLSNKYKFKRMKPIKSIITGFKSNTYAKNNMNYSSLIYVLKHEH